MSAAPDPGPFILFYILGGLVLGLGIFLIIFGRVGKRIDDHPWCRKCRFDLFGRDEGASNKCPECGSDLDKPKAVRVGQRQKRRGLILLGTFVLLLSLGGLGFKGYTDAAGVNWQHHKPVWLLMREANSTQGSTASNKALFELRRRQDAGLLSGSEISRLVNDALKQQADLSQPWNPDWGSLIQIARSNQQVSDTQWQQYATQAVAEGYEYKVRERVDMGKEIPFKIVSNSARVGDSNLGEKLYVRRGHIVTQIGQLQMEYHGASSGVLSSGSNGSTSSVLRMREDQSLDPGIHTADATIDVKLNTANGWNAGPLLANIKINSSDTFELLTEGATSVTVTKDPAYRAAVEQSIQLDKVLNYQYSSKNTKQWDLQSQFDIKPRPVDIAFKIYIRIDGVETKSSVGSFCVPASAQSRWHTSGSTDMDLAGKTIDVILRPSIEDAKRSVDCYNIWGEEIVFEDVVVEKGN